MNEQEFARFLAALAPIVPAIVPLKRGTKIPAVRWKEHPAGVISPDFPDTEARALLTGSRSGGLLVIDADTKDGGIQSLERLENELGPLPATLTVRSPSGGLHIYLASPVGYKTQSRELAPGIDIRGEGGIVVAPGSKHPSGGYYVIEDLPL